MHKKQGLPQGETMKKILSALLLSLLVIGCSSKNDSNEPVEAKLAINKNLTGTSLQDQHETAHTIAADTKTLVFAFSKDVGHECNEFFATKEANYLPEHKAQFIADVSAAPSLIRSMFIMPGLKDFKHTVLVIDDKSVAAGYKAGMQTEKIIVVSLDNGVITAIDALGTTQELEKALQ